MNFHNLYRVDAAGRQDLARTTPRRRRRPATTSGKRAHSPPSSNRRLDRTTTGIIGTDPGNGMFVHIVLFYCRI